MTLAIQKQLAIDLVANNAGNKKTIAEIAHECGVSRRTLITWNADKAFQQAVRTIRNAWRVKARSAGIADQDMRIRHANDEHKRLRSVIMQRAKEMKDIPGGGNTGMLTVTYKMQSQGEGLGSAAVPEYAVDTGLLEQMRALRDQVALSKGEIKLKPKPDIVVNTVNINLLMARINAGHKYVLEHRNDKE